MWHKVLTWNSYSEKVKASVFIFRTQSFDPLGFWKVISAKGTEQSVHSEDLSSYRCFVVIELEVAVL